MKKLKIIIFLLSLITLISNAHASNIEKITVIDDKNIDLELSKDVVLSKWDISSEIKFLKDIAVTFVSKDFNDQNKLILNLTEDLKINTPYNLLTIVWPDANMDFVTWVSLENFEILNTENSDWKTQWLNRIVIKDSKTLELYFNDIIEEDEFEFKILNELNIEKLTSTWSSDISILLKDKIEKLSNYLIMILSIKDSAWNEVIFDEDLYELKTTEDLKVTEDLKTPGDSKTTSDLKTSEDLKINLLQEKLKEDAVVGSSTGNIINEDKTTLESVALNSAETPDTWPETTVLIMLTFIINSIFFMRKKFLKA